MSKAEEAVETILGKEMPEVMKRLGRYNATVMADGAISAKHKELMSLAIALGLSCHPSCINFHIAGSLAGGATKQEILETMAVAMFIGGGRSVVCTIEALPFLNEKTKGIEPVKDLD